MESKYALTRRGVLNAAAWSVPVVTVSAAAPAFAASTPGTFTVNMGATALHYFDVARPPADEEDTEPGSIRWYSLSLAGATVALNDPDGPALTDLTMTVTFVSTVNAPGTESVYVGSLDGLVPHGWTENFSLDPGSDDFAGTQVSFVQPQVSATGTYVLPEGAFIETMQSDESGAFHVQFTAPGFTASTAAVFATSEATESPA